MKSNHCPSYRLMTAVLAGCLVLGLGGCQGPKAVKKGAIDPVFFPSPPSQPRVQFLTSYSGAEDFGGAPKTSFLEAFLLGEPEKDPERIVKPYGMAIHDSKIYVCDVGQSQIKILDLKNNKFSTLPTGRSLQSPSNICIDAEGTKYVADTEGGAIFVYNNENKPKPFLGQDLQIKPIDVAVRGDRLYVADDNSKQLLILDKNSGELLQRIGRESLDDDEESLEDEEGSSEPEFPLISGVALDQHGNIYVSDKVSSTVSKFDASGKYLRSYGKLGRAAGSLVRAKGVAIDKEDRVWVADAGPAQAVKLYRGSDGQSLMILGERASKDPGYMYMPASVRIDYDNVGLFRKYAVAGAQLEFLILVTNQFGPHKVSVYGFGQFPRVGASAKVEDSSEEAP